MTICFPPIDSSNISPSVSASLRGTVADLTSQLSSSYDARASTARLLEELGHRWGDPTLYLKSEWLGYSYIKMLKRWRLSCDTTQQSDCGLVSITLLSYTMKRNLLSSVSLFQYLPKSSILPWQNYIIIYFHGIPWQSHLKRFRGIERER